MSYQSKNNFTNRVTHVYPARYSGHQCPDDAYYGLPHLTERFADDIVGNIILFVFLVGAIAGLYYFYSAVWYFTDGLFGLDPAGLSMGLLMSDGPTLLHWHHNEWADYSAELPSVELVVIEEATQSSHGHKARR